MGFLQLTAVMSRSVTQLYGLEDIAHLVVRKVLQQTGLALVLVIEEDLQHFTPGLVMQLLRITRIGNRLLLWRVDKADMAQSGRRDIADKDPFDLEDALPLVLRPDFGILRFIHPGYQLLSARKQRLSGSEGRNRHTL